MTINVAYTPRREGDYANPRSGSFFLWINAVYSESMNLISGCRVRLGRIDAEEFVILREIIEIDFGRAMRLPWYLGIRIECKLG